MTINKNFVYKSGIKENTTNKTSKVNLRKPLPSIPNLSLPQRDHNKDLQLYVYLWTCKLTNGNTKGSLNPKTDATVNTGSKHEKIAPNKSILPTRGSTGNVARWCPSGVSSSSASSAFYTKQDGSKLNFSLPYRSLTSRQMVRIKKIINESNSAKDARDFMKTTAAY